MFPQNCNELEELIGILFDGDQSGANSGLKNDEYLLTIKNKLVLEDQKTTEGIIRLLTSNLNDTEGRYFDLRASLSIMLAYAHCKLGNQQQVLNHANDAVNPFWHANFWSKGLAFWFLGTVQKNNGNFDETRESLEKAREFLELHAKEAHRKDNITTRDLCYRYIRRIEQVINNLLTRADISRPQPEIKETKSPTIIKKATDYILGRSSPPPPTGPESTPIKDDAFLASQSRSRRIKRDDEKLQSKKREREAFGTPFLGSKPSLFHIVIPVDIQALLNPQSASRALDANLFQRLRDYNLWGPDRNSTNKREQTKNPQTANKPSRVVIPPSKIYGGATAGPDGLITFGEFEWAPAVTEDHQIEFNEVNHTVYPLKEKDTQITVLDEKSCGWLKIQGESMNIVEPIPIENEDFVLFMFTNDFESCENKIVIATQPGPDEQRPLLIVKRLIAIKLKTKRPNNTPKRYYLRSESSRDEYKDDIEFTNDNQLIGEVIAVAKQAK